MLSAQKRNDYAEADDGGFSTTPNASRLPQGGGKKVEHRSFTNLSAKTGKSPEQLIAEHQKK